MSLKQKEDEPLLTGLKKLSYREPRFLAVLPDKIKQIYTMKITFFFCSPFLFLFLGL